MGAGFNLTIENRSDFLMMCRKYQQNCMYHASKYFENTEVKKNGKIGGYCEAKGSGSCAFETSSYSFDIVMRVNGKDEPIARIHGEPGTGINNATYSKVKTLNESTFSVSRAMDESGDNPSFVYTVKYR